jgi:hypothetical protein
MAESREIGERRLAPTQPQSLAHAPVLDPEPRLRQAKSLNAAADCHASGAGA